MYANILIPTDGSELAGKAVQHGIVLAKRIGARITALTVLLPFHTFTTDAQMIEDTPDQYKVRMQKHASRLAAWKDHVEIPMRLLGMVPGPRGSKLMARVLVTTSNAFLSFHSTSLLHRILPVAGLVFAVTVNVAWIGFLGFGLIKLIF